MRRQLLLFFGLITAALLLDYENQLYIVPAIFLFFLMYDSGAFRQIFRWKMVLFLSILVFGVPAIAVGKDADFYGIAYSSSLLQSSVVMVERSLIVLLSIRALTNRITVAQMETGFSRIRLKYFSKVFGTAMTVMPDIRNLAQNYFREYRLSEVNQFRFLNIYLLLVHLFVNVLLFAENYSRKKNVETQSCELY